MILAGTGHRPPRLGLGYDDASRNLLTSFVTDQLRRLDGVTLVVSGMAQGFDQSLAEAALDLGLPYWAAIPFDGFEERWPADAKRRLAMLVYGANEVHVVSGGGYAARKFITRDHWMVDRCDHLLALYGGPEKSGTGATVRYADRSGKPITNLLDEWERHRALVP